MPVKIRLTRRGRKKLALYDVIVADSRSPRDGKFIEKLGTFNPTVNPSLVDINNDRALHWVLTGAQPTDTVRAILSEQGVLLRKHLQVGVNKGAITQDQADKKYQDWIDSKTKTKENKAASLAVKKESARKERLAAEAKVNSARQEALNAKNAALAASQQAENTEAADAAAPADAAPAEGNAAE